jgi:putative molybdopterin biosynthesis protein
LRRPSALDTRIAGLQPAPWRAVGLDFVALRWERFDLVLRQRDYFQRPMQALLKLMWSRSFRDQAAELGGFDVAETGSVRFAI